MDWEDILTTILSLLALVTSFVALIATKTRDERAQILAWIEVLKLWRESRPDFESIVGYAIKVMTPGREGNLPVNPDLRYTWTDHWELMCHLNTKEFQCVWLAYLRGVGRDEFEKIRTISFTLMDFFEILEHRERLLQGRDNLDLFGHAAARGHWWQQLWPCLDSRETDPGTRVPYSSWTFRAVVLLNCCGPVVQLQRGSSEPVMKYWQDRLAGLLERLDESEPDGLQKFQEYAQSIPEFQNEAARSSSKPSASSCNPGATSSTSVSITCRATSTSCFDSQLLLPDNDSPAPSSPTLTTQLLPPQPPISPTLSAPPIPSPPQPHPPLLPQSSWPAKRPLLTV